MSFNRLMGSLLLVVVAGVVGLGFLLTQVYEAVSEPPAEPDRPVTLALAGRLVQTLAEADDLELALAQARAATGYELALVQPQELPPALLADLSADQPLMLQAQGVSRERALSLYFAIPGQRELLLLDQLPLGQAPRSDRTPLWLTLSFYAGLLAVVLLWLTPLVRRLSALQRVTRAFGRGDLQRRLPREGGSLIAAIETDFNLMADRIEELMADNRLLSRAVSHDLKTPLARLRFGVDMLAQPLDADKRRRTGERVERDLAEMESLVQTLLDYARMEGERPELALQPLDLGDFVPSLLAQHDFPRPVRFEPPAGGGATVQADPRYLSMLLLNLINNAMAHGDGETLVAVELRGQQLQLSVEDGGPGVPEERLESVLKPFVKLGGRGHGMGLAIAQRLAGWHGATLTLDRSPTLGGMRARLRLRRR